MACTRSRDPGGRLPGRDRRSTYTTTTRDQPGSPVGSSPWSIPPPWLLRPSPCGPGRSLPDQPMFGTVVGRRRYGHPVADFLDADLTGSRFQPADLTDARFENVDLSGAQIRMADLNGTTFRAVELDHVVMRGVELV